MNARRLHSPQCRRTRRAACLFRPFHGAPRFALPTQTVLCAAAWMLLTHPVPAEAVEAARNIGIEGVVSLDLPRPDYRPLPLDDRTELILRIGLIADLPDGRHRYQLYYIGFEPGAYPLADYLILPDGTRPAELDHLQVEVKATLPEAHNGQLTDYRPGRFPYLGGYRLFLFTLGLLWTGGLGAFIWSYRRKAVVALPLATAREPTLAEQLQPLAEAAAAGELSLEQKARIERLLLGYWRETLCLPPHARVAESLATMKAHVEVGALLRTLERWLHRRTGASHEEVTALLKPHRHPPAAVRPTGGEL